MSRRALIVVREKSEPAPPLSFKRHRFPREVILQAVWLYFRFTLSLGGVEKLLAKRRIGSGARRSAAG